jgi:general secretion pathway protein G
MSVSKRVGCEYRSAIGFTLVELLVVLAILGMLAGLVGPRLFKSLGTANADAARVQIESLAASIDLYRLEVGRFPPYLNALVAAPSNVPRWNGPYLRKSVVPDDPWERQFLYRVPGEHGPYDLWSLGADGVDGGSEENADILGWQ